MPIVLLRFNSKIYNVLGSCNNKSKMTAKIFQDFFRYWKNERMLFQTSHKAQLPKHSPSVAFWYICFFFSPYMSMYPPTVCIVLCVHNIHVWSIYECAYLLKTNTELLLQIQLLARLIFWILSAYEWNKLSSTIPATFGAQHKTDECVTELLILAVTVLSPQSGSPKSPCGDLGAICFPFHPAHSVVFYFSFLCAGSDWWHVR